VYEFGEVAVLGDLVGAQYAHVEVAAAHHGEGVGVVEVSRPRQLDHRDLAGVDQIRVDLADRLPARVEHAVLGVQDHPGFGGEVVADRSRLPDAEVHVRPDRNVRGDRLRDLVLAARAAVGVLDGAGRGDLGHDALFLSVAALMSTIRSTKMLGVITVSGSILPVFTT